jgi:hypothetical protein
MPMANINDRASIERIYPRDAFHRDANFNSLQNTPILHGVTVLSAADETGAFELARHERQTGERDVTQDAKFLPATPTEQSVGHEDEAYASFLARIVDVARSGVRPHQGGESRLHGFHGG